MSCTTTTLPDAWIELHYGTGLGAKLHVRLDRSGQGAYRLTGSEWVPIQLTADDLASIERILNVESFDTLREGYRGEVYDANYSIIRVRRGNVVKIVSAQQHAQGCESDEIRRYARIWNVLITVTAPQERTGMDLAWHDCER